MQNFFSNLAPSGGEEGANSGAPWYMKYAGKAAGIGGGLGKCSIFQIIDKSSSKLIKNYVYSSTLRNQDQNFDVFLVSY